jgi:hypothetical protein
MYSRVTHQGFFWLAMMAGAIASPVVLQERPMLAIRSNAPQQAPARDRWHTARYRGLIVGRSSVSDLLRILGKPKEISTPEGQSKSTARHNVYFFPDAGEFSGPLTVDVDKRTRRVIGIECKPDYLTKDDAIKHFGAGYVETRYTSCGDDSDEVAPLYEALDGQLLYVEYRERGIAICIGYANQVSSIEYLSSGIGFKSKAECEKELRRSKATQRIRRYPRSIPRRNLAR